MKKQTVNQSMAKISVKRLTSAKMTKIKQNRRLTQAMNNSGADT